MDFFQRLGNWFGGKGWYSDEERRRKEQQQAAPQPQQQPAATPQHQRMANWQSNTQSKALTERQYVVRSSANNRNNLIDQANNELNTAIDDKTGYWKEDADKLRDELNRGGSVNHNRVKGLLQSVQNRRKEIAEQNAQEQRMRQRIAANVNERRTQEQIDKDITAWRDADTRHRSNGAFNPEEYRQKLQLRDAQLGVADSNQTVGGVIDDIKNSAGIDQQKKIEGLDAKIKSLNEAFTDEDVRRRDLLTHARAEAEKYRRNDIASFTRGIAKGMTVDLVGNAGEGLADTIHTATGEREKLAKFKQELANHYSDMLQKSIKEGNEQARAYYSQELNRENREINRILGRQVEEADPLLNAGRVANAASLPVAFAAQATGVGVAARTGLTGLGTSGAATTTVGKLIQQYSPQLTGRLAQTTAGKVLNSTPAQLVSRAIPGASPRLQAVAAESVANVLSGMPQNIASTAAEHGSRGRLEDYLVNAATGAAMDAAFPVAAYGVGRGAHYAGKGVKHLSKRVQALDYDLKTQALRRSLVSDSTKPVNTKIANLVDYEGAPDSARVNEYKQAIQDGQEISPLLVMRDSDGRWSVEDGKHRLQAYRELGMKRVPVLPVDKEKLSRVLPEYEAQQLTVSQHAAHPAAANTPYASAVSTGTAPMGITTYSPLEDGARQSSGVSDGATSRHAHTPYGSDNPSVYTVDHVGQDLAGTSSYDTSVAQGGTSRLESTLRGFDRSANYAPVARVGDTEVVIGDYGRNAAARKASSADRFDASELSETLRYVTNAYKSGDSSFRKDNLALVATMPDGEKRVVYTRLNRNGQEEIINWHKITIPEYEDGLKSYGTPAWNRTRNFGLEHLAGNPSHGSAGSERGLARSESSLHDSDSIAKTGENVNREDSYKPTKPGFFGTSPEDYRYKIKQLANGKYGIFEEYTNGNSPQLYSSHSNPATARREAQRLAAGLEKPIQVEEVGKSYNGFTERSAEIELRKLQATRPEYEWEIKPAHSIDYYDIEHDRYGVAGVLREDSVQSRNAENVARQAASEGLNRDIESSNGRENPDAEYAPKGQLQIADQLQPAGDSKFGNLADGHIITKGNLYNQTKLGEADITSRPVEDGLWEYRQHKKQRYNKKTEKWETFRQIERRFIGKGGDGKWKPYSRAAYTWYNDPNIDKLSLDEKIAAATEIARKDGEVYDFVAERQLRYDKRGNVIGEQMTVKPIKDYGRFAIDGGLVRDAQSGEVVGSHVQITPFGAVYQIEGRMAILEEDAFRTMKNKSGVFDTFARASEKNAELNTEMFHNLIDESRNAQAAAKVEQVEVKDIAAKAADDVLQHKPRKMSTSGFFRALGEYVENKVPMSDRVNGEPVTFKSKEEAFEHWYGKDALEGAQRYDETIRSLYDRLIDEANEVRRRLGQPEIEYRKDYMAHIWDDDGIITQWLRDGVSTFGIHGDFAAAGRGKIPAWIAGRSDMTKPMKRFNRHELSRKGAEGYILDPRVAFERAADAMILNTHLEPVIAKGRSMESAIVALDALDKEMMGAKKSFDRYVSEDLENSGVKPSENAASDQKVALIDFVNALAGKSSRFDREMLNSMPKTMRFIRHAEAINGANKIMGNLSSVMAQALNMPGTMRENGLKNTGWAIAHVNSRAMKDAQSKSPFLTERYTNSTGKFEKSKWQSTREFVSKYTAMDITENTFVRINWTANYARLKKQGLRGRELILQTDRATARAVGDRSIGAMPPAYESALGKMFLQFTYEVNENWKNDLEHVKGIAGALRRGEFSKAGKMSVTGAEALATAMAMNWLYKTVTGHAPLPDPVGAIMSVIDNAQKDDEDDSKRNPFLYGITSGVSQLAKANPAAAATVNMIPKRYREEIFGKDSDFGRFDGATGVAQTGANFISAGHYALEGEWGKAAKSGLGVAPMGSQIKKTLGGYGAMADGTIKTESGKVLATVDSSNPLKWAQALAFGKNSLKEAQEGYSRETGILSGSQSKIYDEIRKSSGNDVAKEYLDSVHKVRELKYNAKSAGAIGKSTELTLAEAEVKMKNGDWREEDGLIVDKQGNVQRAHYKALAQSQGESDEAYDNWTKAYDIDNAGSKPRRKTGNSMVDNLQAEKDKVNSADTAVKLFTDAEKYRDLPDWVKDRYYKKSGYKKHEIEYAALSSYGSKEKLNGYWLPRAEELSHDDLIQELTNGRRESIHSSGNILAPNGVIDNLMIRGFISRDEAKALKKAKFAHDGTPKQTAGQSNGRGSGRGGSGSSRGGTSLAGSVVSAYQQSVQMSKALSSKSSLNSSAPQVGGRRLQKTALKRWSPSASRVPSRKTRKGL